MIRISAACSFVAALAVIANAQQVQLPSPAVPLQPLAQQVRQMETALSYLGQPFSADELARIDEAIADAQESEAVKRLQSVLDPHVLALDERELKCRGVGPPGDGVRSVGKASVYLELVGRRVCNTTGRAMRARRVHWTTGVTCFTRHSHLPGRRANLRSY